MGKTLEYQQKEIKDYYNRIFEVDARRKLDGEYVDLLENPGKLFRILDVHSGFSYRERFFKYLQVQPNKKLLDIGCGFGDLIKMAEKKGVVAYGMDISEKAVEVAKWNTQLDRIFCGNAETLPFEDRFFDYLTAIGVLEHLLDSVRSLKEMQRICADDGRLLIVVPNFPVVEYFKNIFRKKKIQLKATEQVYENVLSLKSWKMLLEESGLKILKVYKDNHTWIKKDFSFKDCLRIFRRVIRKMLPLGFSYQFIFLCVKRNAYPK